MASIHDWTSPLALGSHHIARALADGGWDVAYVSSGISPVEALKDPRRFLSRLSHYAMAGQRERGGHLWSYFPLALLTPHNAPVLRTRFVHQNWQRLTTPNLFRTVRSHGFASVDLLYLDTPIQMFWLDAIPHRVSVARIMDRASGFTGVAAEYLAMERSLITSVDLVAYAARALRDELEHTGAKRTMHLPNGVDFSHFAEGDRAEPPEFRTISSPRAIYVGDIAAWFDFATVNEVTERIPEVSFVFVGPERLARERITARPNVHILGPRPFTDLPRYVHNADVGLIPFDVDGHPRVVNAVHPLKLYEYMACGLPVVATRWQELESLASPAILCDDPSAFVAGIRASVRDPGDGEDRIAFARSADWTGRVQALLEACDRIGLA